ncbi:PepSY domain-containing protein [Spongiibacter sp.]|uniref:PepSY domain-containing protein n=1 Tax=Spongiibacter sp. TaxID=2024860 RepID=UPI003562DA2B
MKRRQRQTRLALLLAGSLLSGHIYAGSLLDSGVNRGLGQRPRIDAPQQHLGVQQRLSAREAIAIAERRYGGRAVGAKKIPSSHGSAYRVRILQKNGKIKNVIIDNN